MTYWPRCELEALRTPAHGAGVCPVCFNLIDRRAGLCRACRLTEQHLGAVLPISYALGRGALHARLAAYKRDADPFVSSALGSLAELLDRFLITHERCLAGGQAGFELVTVVPSSDRLRDRLHPLRRIVSELVGATRRRHLQLLAPGPRTPPPGRFSRERFRALDRLEGQRVLLVDDMWTTGASAQSAAATLLAAGASAVSAVVIGRYLTRDYAQNQARLQQLSGEFSWSRCAVCARREQLGAEEPRPRDAQTGLQTPPGLRA